METKLTPTQGAWGIAREYHEEGMEIYVATPLKWISVIKAFNYTSIEEAEDNAELICDAGNTFQKCHLLPSQLLQQRDELMEALMKLKDEAWRNGVSSEYVHEFCKETIQKYQI